MQSRQRKSMGMKKAAWAILLLVGLSGCASIGPGTISRDRFDYITAISDSWKITDAPEFGPSDFQKGSEDLLDTVVTLRNRDSKATT